LVLPGLDPEPVRRDTGNERGEHDRRLLGVERGGRARAAITRRAAWRPSLRAPCSIWGLPFFYGRAVYTAIDGRSTPGGNGPYYAF
jgi:hypothetical protein